MAGRPKGSKNGVKSGVVSNNKALPKTGSTLDSAKKALTEDQQRKLLLQAIPPIQKLKEKIASVTGELRALYKAAKADGITKQRIDDCIAAQKDPDSFMQRIKDSQQTFLWTHPDRQAELFGETDRMPIEDKTFEDGKLAGLKGESGAVPNHVPGPLIDAWTRGYNAGQAVNMEGIKQLDDDDADLRPPFLRESDSADEQESTPALN